MKRILTFSLLVLMGFCAVAQSITLIERDVQLSQNTPNPFNGTTDVYLTVAEAGTVSVEIADINGRTVVGANNYSPLPGTHQFRVTIATPGTYVMTVRQNGQTSSIKMICNGGGNGNRVEYCGGVETCHGNSVEYCGKVETRHGTSLLSAPIEESEDNDEATNEEKKNLTFEAIKGDAKKIRYELSKVIRARTVPELHFFLDGSMEYGDKMEKLFKSINQGEKRD